MLWVPTGRVVAYGALSWWHVCLELCILLRSAAGSGGVCGFKEQSPNSPPLEKMRASTSESGGLGLILVPSVNSFVALRFRLGSS